MACFILHFFCLQAEVNASDIATDKIVAHACMEQWAQC